MSELLQNLLVFMIIAICVGVVLTQSLRIFRGKRACCSKGCGVQKQTGKPATQFMPIESLQRRRI